MVAKAKPIVVIIGPTASGKTSLAVEAAQRFDGEVIGADSRDIYKSMDIGTGKATLDEQKLVPHYGLDLIEPDTGYSAAEHKRYINDVVKKIHARNKLPIVVGGTGLYIDAFVYDFSFGQESDPATRTSLEYLGLDELQAVAKNLNISEQQVDFRNRRHLSRAIERGGSEQKREPKPANILIIGLKIEKEILHKKISDRVDKMFNDGLVQEVQKLVNLYGPDAPGLNSAGYKEAIDYIKGTCSLEEAMERVKRSHRYLAKRQMTWFRRNQDIEWCEGSLEAITKISAFISKFDTINA